MLEFIDLQRPVIRLAFANETLVKQDSVDCALAADILSDEHVIQFAGQLSTARAGAIAGYRVSFSASEELQADFAFKTTSKGVSGASKHFQSVHSRDIAMNISDKLTHAEIVRAMEKVHRKSAGRRRFATTSFLKTTKQTQ